MITMLCSNCSRQIKIDEEKGFEFCPNCGKQVYMSKAGTVKKVLKLGEAKDKKVLDMAYFGWEVESERELDSKYTEYTFVRSSTLDMNIKLKEIERNYNELNQKLIIVPKMSTGKYIALLICFVVPGIRYKKKINYEIEQAKRAMTEKEEKLQAMVEEARELIVELKD